MTCNDPDFIACALQAIEEGVAPEDIAEECSYRLGLASRLPDARQTPQSEKE